MCLHNLINVLVIAILISLLSVSVMDLYMIVLSKTSVMDLYTIVLR